MVGQSQRLLLQLRHFLPTLLAEASLLLRLRDGDRAGALGGRSAAAPRVLRGQKPFPRGHRRLSARTSLHLQQRDNKKVWLLSELGNYYFILIDNTCVTTKTNVRGVTCRRTAEHLPNTAKDYFKS